MLMDQKYQNLPEWNILRDYDLRDRNSAIFGASRRSHINAHLRDTFLRKWLFFADFHDG